MSKISETFEVGNRDNLTPEKMLELIEIMYKQLAVAINKRPELYERDTDGQSTDTFLSNGDFSINKSTGKVEVLTSHTNPTTVVWKTLS